MSFHTVPIFSVLCKLKISVNPSGGSNPKERAQGQWSVGAESAVKYMKSWGHSGHQIPHL